MVADTGTAGVPAMLVFNAPRATADSKAPSKDGPKIAQIAFTGNHLFSTNTLQDVMQLHATNWSSWYTGNDTYSQDKLDEALDRLHQYYLDHGFIEFKIESAQTSPMSDGKGVALAIALHEGERYTLSSIRVEGAPPELQQQLAALNELQAGEVLSAATLLASSRAIVDSLSAQGYPNAAVNPLSQVDADHHTVDMTLQIDLGRRVTVRRIEVTGNTITCDEVVRREMRQAERDGYDAKKIALSGQRLDSLGYFSKVDIKTVPVPDAPDQVDVDVNVAERPGAALTFGIGYSTSDRVVAQAGITEDNLFGTGQSISARAATARPYRHVALVQSNPYFTSGGVSRTTSAWFHINEPLYYSSDSRFKVVTQGIDVRFGMPLSDSDKLYTGVALEHNRLDPDALTPQTYVDYVNRYGRESTNVPVMLGWSRDTRDSAAQTTHGTIARAGIEYGTPAAGSEYYKADVGVRYYQHLPRNVVLAMNVQAGFGAGVGNRPYPIFRNYYAGGIGSVRGYEPNSLSPRDVKTGQPVGGSKMLTGSMELKLPLAGNGNDRKLGAFTFLDGGNVWGGQSGSTGSNGMRFSYGAGFAWHSPVGSFKVSAGFPIVRHETDRYQTFQMQFETML